jgi:putative DNA methylase
MPYKKKLIEVALPLEAINAASAREKSIRHGHPSTLHLWWARRPLAAARAVIFASLVDDPSACPEQFPTLEAQAKERSRLFGIIEELVVWENSNNPSVLQRAKAEILKSTGNNPPALLDPFAGGGSIPLEAQRLGLVAHAGDLNPVAVTINKAMIEIPPRFAALPPTNPAARRGGINEGWQGAAGLAEDVRYYGEWMKSEAWRRIGHLYPRVAVPKEQGGGEATVIAWLWARTVKCPNPACGCDMPLASTFVVSKKPGREAYVRPIIDGNQIRYSIEYGNRAPKSPKTARGAKFECVKCRGTVQPDYIKAEAVAGRMGAALMVIVAEGRNGRFYVTPEPYHAIQAQVSRPAVFPTGELAGDRRAIWCPAYGLDTFDKLFTNRQLTALTTFADLVKEAQQKATADAVAAGMPADNLGLADGGSGARAYGQAVGVYLGIVLDKLADYNSALCSWHVSRETLGHTFARQALPMVWDYAEVNPFSNSSGCWDNMLEWVVKAVQGLPASHAGDARQFDAQSDSGLGQVVMVSTDPPYYDNIGYADLSDFFYIWLRQSLKDTYPKLFRTMLVPKVEELVATPYRFDGDKEQARDFFEDGMKKALRQIYLVARDDVPVTIYYAFKQSETDEDDEGDTQTASTGWETMLSAIVQAGFVITGTWPMRTEMANRSVGIGTNALASSIVLVCRKRTSETALATRREFVAALKRELRPALQQLQQSNIAPVDLAQAAIGPGMAVYSRYAQVLEADGTPMGVRGALHTINQELDLYFAEQDGELDRDSRFCVELYAQSAFNSVAFGQADVLARAKNTSVDRLAARGVLEAQKGYVRLLTREELPSEHSRGETVLWLLTQELTRAMATGGVSATAALVMDTRAHAESAKALAYRLFTIAERKGWAGEAYAYNALVVAWPDVQEKVAELDTALGNAKQTKLF